MKLTKTCSFCKEIFPATSEYFYKSKKGKFGLKSRCKKCRDDYNKTYRKKNYEKRRISELKSRLFTNFGLSLKNYNKMLEKQNNVCAICGCPEKNKAWSGIIKRLSIDHNHKTGKIRGLLCDNCNRGLGYFKENTLILVKTIEYLQQFKI